MTSFLWSQSDIGTLITLDVNEIQETIKEVPDVDAINADNKFMAITLPLPDGSNVDFVIKHAPLVKKDSPLYNTTAGQVYSLYGVDKAGYSGSMILYQDGIHATINTPNGLLSIGRTSEEFVHDYVYFKDTGGFPHSPNDAEYPDALPIDNVNAPHQHSINEPEHTHDMPDMRNSLANNNFLAIGGGNTRKVLDVFIMSELGFRNKFASQSLAEARIVEIINAVKVIFERDMNLTVNYLGVYFKPSAEGSSTGNAKALYNSLSDADVPNGTKADVDAAHLLTGVSGSGAHGAGGIGVACIHELQEGGSVFDGLKASGYSAAGNPSSSIFPPLVAHELGHQLGGYHTWTGQAGSCTAGQYGNRSGVEPGSGNTMAAYSGICGSDNIPSPGNEDYLHTESIREMATFATTLKLKEPSNNVPAPAVGEIPVIDYTYINFTGLTQCIASESYANNVPQANSNPNGLSNMNIPARTPFELMGSATDGDDDNLTYQWDQMDFAISQAALDGYATRVDGPLFRSFGSSSSPTRIFPQLSDILVGTQTQGEILPQTNRRMRFACTVRDGKGGVGVDTVGFNVVDSGTGFSIKFKIIDGSSTVVGPFNAITTSNPIIVTTIDYTGDTNKEVEIEVICIIPTATAPANTTVCAGASVPAQSFTSTEIGTTYAWASNTDIGFGTSGSGDIATFAATNTGSEAAVAIIIVTPTANTCEGTADTFKITVNPLPSVTAIGNINVEVGATIPATNFSGTAGATFNWTNDNTAIGLATDGIGDIAAFTATNTSDAAISATVNVTPSLNGCLGATQTFTITVNPVVTNNCQGDDLTIPSVTNGTDYIAGNTITSNATIPATFQVIYQAGQSITLQNGFHAEASSDFTARIAPCNNVLNSPEEASLARNTLINNEITSAEKSGLTMQIHPNPARSSIEINYHLGTTSTTSIVLYNLTGKQLKVLSSNQEQLKGLHQQQVDISDLKAGIYFVLLANEGQVLTKKLVVIE